MPRPKEKLAIIRVIDKVKLPEKYNRIKKVSSADCKKMIKLYATGNYTHKSLGDKFGISSGRAGCIVNPENAKRNAEYQRNWLKRSGYKYSDAAEYIRDLRARKKQLIKKGVIKI